MIGKIIKIHSDFYYVNSEDKVIECKVREKLKKEKAEILVGDLVHIEEFSADSNTGAIAGVLPRKNSLPRPSVANIDLVIVVSSIFQPELDFKQLNRYLCQAKLYDLEAIICINKFDLDSGNKLSEKVSDIYSNLGYRVIFTSALTGEGIEDLINTLESKVSVLCGMSGVGKTSLLNKLNPELNLRTKDISEKSKKGTHTTRHVEILNFNTDRGQSFFVADTPGFSYLKFDTVMPSVITELFDEIKDFSKECGFSDCLHITENNCNVLANLDKINTERYESYKLFTQEAMEYKEKLYKEGHKNEKNSKFIDTGSKAKKLLVKLSPQKRKNARNTINQKINSVSILDEVYYNQEE